MIALSVLSLLMILSFSIFIFIATRYVASNRIALKIIKRDSNGMKIFYHSIGMTSCVPK